jgi:carbon-monoxide dehydrogenase large subunit
MNAIADALSAYGVLHVDMPATPLKIWQTMHNGQRVAAE